MNDCGPYGQCLLLRRHGYLYAGCSCKAGEGQAWMPPDNTIVDFSALCLPLGAHPTLPRLESTLTEQEQMPSPHSCHIPPPCKHRKAPPEMVLPLTLASSAHTRPQTCPIPDSHLPTSAPYLPTRVPHVSHTCPIPAPHIPIPVSHLFTPAHACLIAGCPCPHQPILTHTCPTTYTCPSLLLGEKGTSLQGCG